MSHILCSIPLGEWVVIWLAHLLLALPVVILIGSRLRNAYRRLPFPHSRWLALRYFWDMDLGNHLGLGAVSRVFVITAAVLVVYLPAIILPLVVVAGSNVNCVEAIAMSR
jgi:hypothetical protein